MKASNIFSESVGFVCLCLMACTSGTINSTGEIVPEQPVTAIAQTRPAPNDVVGTWHGFVPCAGCPALTYNLVLMDDYSFKEKIVYEDREGEPVTRIGTWSVTDGMIELSGDTRTRFSLPAAGELRMLDLAGKPINNDVASQAVLKRTTAGNQTGALTDAESTKVGVDFVASGHDPAWVLEIDMEKDIDFRTRPSASISITAPTPAPAKNGNETLYRVKAAGGEMVVVLREQRCEDAMSGKARPYSVRVTTGGKVYEGCGLFLNEDKTN